MFAYPVGPARDVSLHFPFAVLRLPLYTIIQSLFLDRESAETMDPRTDRTSAVRTRLLNILSVRIQAIPSQSVTPKLSNVNAPSTRPSLSSTEEPATGIPQDGSTSLPRIPSLSFGLSVPEAARRALTPIVESSVSERDPSRLPVSGATVTSSDNTVSSPLSQEVRYEETNATSPAQISPPSAYTPTDTATSVPVSPPHELEIEMAFTNASTGKPSPVVVSTIGGSSERPFVNDDNRAKDVSSPTSVRSLHSSAASPPSLSPANSSNPPASVSPAQVPPRTPSPRLSILTSPHSPRPNQSFAEVVESLGSQSLISPLHVAPIQPSKLSQDPMQRSTDSSWDGANGISDEAGALYVIHQLEQGSLDGNSQAAPEMDVPLESEITPFSQFVQPTISPLRPKTTSPPPRSASSGRSLPALDVPHRKPPNQPLPRTPTLDYGPERRPVGARAARVSNRQDTFSSAAQPPRDGHFRQASMSQFEDPDADALAALTFLERQDDNDQDTPAPAPMPPSSSLIASPLFHPREGPPSIVEPDMQPPSPESENASVYKSSFAPSKNAMQRKARTEAQQAAHDAATHRPGRGTAKTKNKPKSVGAWGDSSEEEDEEDEDEDEDVDSDGQPVVPRDDRSVSGYAVSLNQRSRLSTPRGPSPLASGGDAPPQPPPRPPRNLPPVPFPRGQGVPLASPILYVSALTISYSP
jgi:CCR4-NOT transcriptional complex subunit CAF120